MENKGLDLDVEFKPKQVNTDDQGLKLKQVIHRNGLEDQTETKTSLDYQSPTFGPAKLWLNVNIFF